MHAGLTSKLHGHFPSAVSRGLAAVQRFNALVHTSDSKMAAPSRSTAASTTTRSHHLHSICNRLPGEADIGIFVQAALAKKELRIPFLLSGGKKHPVSRSSERTFRSPARRHTHINYHAHAHTL